MVKAAPVAKAPSLHAQVIGQFKAAFFAQFDRDYHLSPADKSQVGRFLNPGGGEAPSEALLAELPVIFANFVATDSRFHQENMTLAFVLAKALNVYRVAGKPKPAPVSRRQAEQEAAMRALVRVPGGQHR